MGAAILGAPEDAVKISGIIIHAINMPMSGRSDRYSADG
jgi:hypothetical protein